MHPALRKSLFQLDEHITENTASSSHNAELDKHLQQLTQSAADEKTDNQSIEEIISLYKKTIVKLEQHIWHGHHSKENLKLYQNMFKTLEGLYNLKTSDDRYSFKIVIPVADRPQHLQQCLNSLLTLCKCYKYGGFKNNQFTKISVLIADDSRDKNNIKLHKGYCTEFSNKGIKTEYFGLQEQLTLVNMLSANNDDLTHIISSTNNISDITQFSHKGASIMRNITYLKLNQTLCRNTVKENTLIYFIDSDQEFCVNTAQSDDKHYAINYFHYLNENFTTQNISMLTGKVVGDPPVSPAVMAANFQHDIKNFVATILNLNPEGKCQFHKNETDHKDDAAYHDMANLFGFSNQEQFFNYHCTLPGNHHNGDCFNDFANKLDHFFYGEHPTRKTAFYYENGFTATSPARTVYTGNYVIKPEALVYFIPFANLKLRMAGPVLGRIMKAKLQQGFVSANLPMLHNRTIDSTGQSEFRAGVINNNNAVDLGNEFIRQFYGDVMLFAMEKFTEEGFPDKTIDRETIQSILNATYNRIKETYIEKHNTILQLKSQINEQIHNQKYWWNHSVENSHKYKSALINFDAFLENIQSNFDDNTDSYLQCTSSNNAKQHLDKLLQAVFDYQDDLTSWNIALNSQ